MDILNTYPEIKNCSIFEASDDRNIARYIDSSSVRVADFNVGEEIFSQGMSDVSPAILLCGTAYINASDDPKSLLLRSAAAGSLFGIATLYSSSTEFPTRITAKTACRVLFIKADALRNFIENDTNATKRFLRIMGDKVVYLNKKLSTLTSGSAERKLSLFLCENENDGTFTLNTSATALAEMLGIGRASLYRAFEKLESEGLIKREEKTITLTSKEAIIEKYFGSVVTTQKQNL